MLSRLRALVVGLFKIVLVLIVLTATFVVTVQSVRAETSNANSPRSSLQAGGVPCAMTRGGEYEKADPAAAGLDPAKLRAAMDYANLSNPFTIKVFRRGCLVAEGLRDPLFDRVPANNWGQTKTITALITGIAQDQGLVDIDAPIGTYLPAKLGDAAHRAVTLRNLLQASSGVKVNQVRGLNFYADQSRAREFFTMPIVHKPGTYFEYDQTAVSVIIYVVQRAIWQREPGLDFQNFAQRELFDRLGIPRSAYFWQRDGAGGTTAYSQLFLRPRENGRLAELFRTGGIYDGKRVISERYLRELRTPARSNCGYGFLTYLNSCRSGQTQVNLSIPTRRELGGVPWVASAPADMIFTAGVGIRTFVIPSLDLVVTRTGEAQEPDLLPSVPRVDVEGVVPGRVASASTHDFFRLLMAAVIDMPQKVRATIMNPGPYDRGPDAGVDATHFLYPLDAPAGTYLSVGPGAPEGCNPLGCKDESNDGTQRWISDIPRTVPGILGAETRSDGY
ncbi:MAG: serine hydrolase domain-containing protein [Pseudonocardiaceae bacterium]